MWVDEVDPGTDVKDGQRREELGTGAVHLLEAGIVEDLSVDVGEEFAGVLQW